MATANMVEKWEPNVQPFSNHWWFSRHVRNLHQKDVDQPPEGWTFATHDFKDPPGLSL